jgi:hypothetical protein
VPRSSKEGSLKPVDQAPLARGASRLPRHLPQLVALELAGRQAGQALHDSHVAGSLRSCVTLWAGRASLLRHRRPRLQPTRRDFSLAKGESSVIYIADFDGPGWARTSDLRLDARRPAMRVPRAGPVPRHPAAELGCLHSAVHHGLERRRPGLTTVRDVPRSSSTPPSCASATHAARASAR